MDPEAPTAPAAGWPADVGGGLDPTWLRVYRASASCGRGDIGSE